MALRLEVWEAMAGSDFLRIGNETTLFLLVMEYAELSSQKKKTTEKSRSSKKKKWRKTKTETDPAIRNHILDRLLPLLRWSFIPANFVVKLEEDQELLASYPTMANLIHAAYRARAVPGLKQTLFCLSPRRGFQSFDPEEMTNALSLSDNNRTGMWLFPGVSCPGCRLVNVYKVATLSGQPSVWHGVRCTVPFSASVNYTEFRLVQCSSLCVGVCHGSVMQGIGNLGSITNAVVLAQGGHMWENGQSKGTGGRQWTVAARVGVMFDVETNKIQFYLNGTTDRTATLNLTSGSHELCFPFIYTSSARDKISILPSVTAPSTTDPGNDF